MELFSRCNFSCNSATKFYIFICINCLFMACGIASLAVGIWLYTDRNDFVELTPSSFSALSAAGLCCFTGATVCIISVVGCTAAWMEGRCLMYTYVGFVLLLGLVHFVTGTTGFFYKDSAREHVRLDLLRNINATYVMTRLGRKIDLSLTWDHLQRSLKCCGANGFRDWYYSSYWPRNEFVPDSCCDPQQFNKTEDMKNCGKVPDHNSNFFQEGCFPVFADWLFHHIIVVNWASIVLIFIELTVLIMGCMILRHISQFRLKDYRRTRRQIVEEANEQLQLGPMDRLGDAASEYNGRSFDGVSIDSR